MPSAGRPPFSRAADKLRLRRRVCGMMVHGRMGLKGDRKIDLGLSERAREQYRKHRGEDAGEHPPYQQGPEGS